MSLTASQFSGHPIWKALEQLGPLLDQAATRDGIDAEIAERIARLKAVLTFAGKRLAGADPFLIQVAHLNNTDTALRAVSNQVSQFISNGNAPHIQNADLEADNVLAGLAYIHVPFTTEDFLAAKEAAEEYRIAFQKLFDNIKNQGREVSSAITSLQPRVTELTSSVEVLKQQIASTSATHQAQFEAALSARQDEWKIAQTNQQNRIDALVTEYRKTLDEHLSSFTAAVAKTQSDFEESQRHRATEWQNIKKQYDDQISATVNQFKKALDQLDLDFVSLRDQIAGQNAANVAELKKEFADSAKDLLDAITTRKHEADSLLGIIADRGVTSGHQKAADEARSSKRLWQVVTVLSMLGLIALAIFTFLPQLAGTFTWESFAGRVFISLTVGVLAAYAGSQADRYQKIERYSKNLALELQAVGPYIAPLPQDKQDEFRLKLGERSFGQSGSATGVDGKSPTSLADLVGSSKDLGKFTAGVIKATGEAIKDLKDLKE